MAVPPLTADGVAVVELDEEIDGDYVGTKNYQFSKIGESVPIKSDDASEFDPQCIPSQPLAVSERFRLLFVAHSQGFCVARTKDVMASAEEIKEKKTGPSIQELSFVDVPIGKVSILALSADDSLLAVCIESRVHFFAVSALLHKEQKPSFSVSLDDSMGIKDVRWARKVARDYVILSSSGKLYHGSGQGPLICVMEEVDAVDWSVKGNFVAVAKKNTVSIFSSQFEEKLRFSLSFKSVIGDSDVNQVIKADSIRWIRQDSIAVGCFQLNDDGEEENYIIQVITSRGRSITDAASKPTVLSFSSIFFDFCSDAVPARNGPHLFLSYLNRYGLSFIASRNLSQQVGLFTWSSESGRNEAAAVEILNDAWILHIDSQGNGDENVILGLSVDKVSQNENVRFTLGDEETEVSPCCIVICLTIDGKVSVFHFASAVGALESPEGCASDEEENASQVSVKQELSRISSAVGDRSRDPTFSASESHEPGRIEVEKPGAKASVTNNLSPSFHVDMRPQGQIATGNWGHKPLVEPQTLKVDEPEKFLSVVPNQDINAGNQSTRTDFFSGKVVGDISNQLRSNPLLSASNVEQVGKAPPTSLPSVWSSARSNARVDASKTSDGRSLSLFSDQVDNSDKIPLQSARVVLQDPADLTEKARPSATSISSGQITSTAQGNKNLLSAYPGSRVPPVESVVSGKSLISGFKKDLNAASSPTGLPYSVQNSSKQFGNVEEMAKKLDNLLEGIVGKGGFREASINSQANSVKELEDGILALSDRCRVWRGLVNKQSRELQLLLDKTVQVLVRKVYVEGIFKQATDSRYWELWNRQKLSSELELKRRRILELNQELTNKLIELERHFNSLEFNKFGENGGQRNRKLLQSRQGHSRQIQSLHSLHNTMHAQLAAAEQLSGCLSKQMAALSIESSGKPDIKKQLFDSIGLSYAGDTKKSPARNRALDTPTTKGHLITSGSIAAQDHSRNQDSIAKSFEPETARRRRESLDRSWASFDPPKTTVKRMLKEDHEKGSVNRSLLNIDKQYFSPQSQKKPEVARSAPLNISGASLNGYNSKGTAEIPAEKLRLSPLTSSYQRTGVYSDQGVQVSSTKTLSALPQPSLLEKRATQHSEIGGFKLIDEKSKSNLPSTGRNSSFTASESKFVQQSDTKIPSITTPSDSTQSSDLFKIGFTKSTTWDQKNTRTVSETPPFDFKIPVAPESGFSSGSNVSQKGLFTESSQKPSQPNDGLSASAPLQTAFRSSSFVSKPISSALLPATPASFGASAAAKQEVSQPPTSVPSTPSFTFTLPSSSRESNVSSISPSKITESEPVTSLSHPTSTTLMYGSKTDDVSERQTSVANTPSKTEKDTKVQDSASQPEFAVSKSDLKLGTSSQSALSGLSATKSIGGFDFGFSSKSSSVVKTELTSATESPSPVAPSGEGTISSSKNVVPDSSHEEEMEEEAPETDQTTGFTLGNLSGFGLGSTPSSTTPKSNPFGVSNLNKDTPFATSPYTMSPSSGELFRPASFNFQSPQSSGSSQQTSVVNFPGGFSSGVPGQVSAAAGFGQPSNIGAGQQALGSVLGGFGQSRQIGAGLSGNNVASASGFGSGFTGISAGGFGGGFNAAAAPGGGFGGGFNAAAAATGGGFASLAAGAGGFASAGGGFGAAATAGGGFAAAATSGGGFAAAATSGGGFAAAGGGFASSATPGAVSGGGFGGFGNQQGGGGFSAFGGGSGAARPPSELFTQMRK